MITFKVEIEREDDGRWLAEVVELPGVLASAIPRKGPSRRFRLWPSGLSLSAWNTAKPAPTC